MEFHEIRTQSGVRKVVSTISHTRDAVNPHVVMDVGTGDPGLVDFELESMRVAMEEDGQIHAK